MSGTSGSITERLPIRHGAIVGAGGWIVGIVVSYALAQAAGVSGSAVLGVSVLDLSIVFYFMLHLWPLVLAPGTDMATAALMFTPIAVAILMVGGYRVASHADNAESGFRNGATATVGYFVLAVLSLLFALGSVTQFLFQQATGRTIVVVLFTGVLVPVVFGGLGGAIADWRSD
ncbi:hypothetical protein BRC81_15335 [Halobacteriales archaeon QS_1_68_20]|nr:MAG: hypothetical protein BRC81_15335 [Halobacteriales archaeon QS_1_68_20]